MFWLEAGQFQVEVVFRHLVVPWQFVILYWKAAFTFYLHKK